MKKSIFVFILLLGFQNSFSQNLEPNNSIFEIFDFQYEYYSKIRTELFEDLDYAPEVRLVVLPSFSPEYIFQIEKIKNNNHFLAILRFPEIKIYGTVEHGPVKNSINEYTSTIEKEDVEILKKVYLNSIRKAHYPIKDGMGLDGTSYFLSAWDYGLKSATIWSPRDTINQTIISITEDLIEQLKKGKNKISISQKDKDLLLAISEKLSTLPDLETYQLITETKKVIDNNKSYYNSQISEKNKYWYEPIVQRFEQELLLKFVYNNLDKENLKNLINKYQKELNKYLDLEIHRGSVENVEEYVNKNLKDNIFIKLKSELNYE